MISQNQSEFLAALYLRIRGARYRQSQWLCNCHKQKISIVHSRDKSQLNLGVVNRNQTLQEWLNQLCYLLCFAKITSINKQVQSLHLFVHIHLSSHSNRMMNQWMHMYALITYWSCQLLKIKWTSNIACYVPHTKRRKEEQKSGLVEPHMRGQGSILVPLSENFGVRICQLSNFYAQGNQGDVVLSR